jgi:hypothetical protein
VPVLITDFEIGDPIRPNRFPHRAREKPVRSEAVQVLIADFEIANLIRPNGFPNRPREKPVRSDAALVSFEIFLIMFLSINDFKVPNQFI